MDNVIFVHRKVDHCGTCSSGSILHDNSPYDLLFVSCGIQVNSVYSLNYSSRRGRINLLEVVGRQGMYQAWADSCIHMGLWSLLSSGLHQFIKNSYIEGALAPDFQQHFPHTPSDLNKPCPKTGCSSFTSLSHPISFEKTCPKMGCSHPSSYHNPISIEKAS